ncbi:MAG: glycosyltransferase [Bacteroidota bacterium]
MLISVIIPTLNEAEFIVQTIQNTLKHANDVKHLELIVVDSGSTDNTPDLVQSTKDVSFYFHPELKGKKSAILNQGAGYAKGQAFIFLDADTHLPLGFDDLIRHQLMEGGVIGGAFEFKLDADGLAIRFIELINRTRYRLGKRYYGDQAVFCTREAFDQVGGYPERLILESAHFCASLQKTGKIKLIRHIAVTSARRFTENRFGPLWVLTKDTFIFLMDKLNLKNDRLARKYWKFNEEK